MTESDDRQVQIAMPRPLIGRNPNTFCKTSWWCRSCNPDGLPGGLAKVLDPLLPCNRLSRPFSCACICPRTLATNGQPKAVPHPSIALDFSETVNRLTDLTTKWTFDREITLEQTRQAAQLILIQFPRLFGWVDFGFHTRFSSNRRSDAVEILKRIDDLFVVWNINTQKTRHTSPLLNHCPVTIYGKTNSFARELER